MHLEILCIPPFRLVSEQLLLHLEPSQGATPDHRVMSIDIGENQAEYIAQRGGNFGPACLVPATTTTTFSLRAPLRRAGGCGTACSGLE